jgi:hypothetical protein
MNKIKRLCPVCGVDNPMERETCRACGAEMASNLPVPLGQRYPVPWKEVGASLAVGAGALALRAGVHLARHLLERQAATAVELTERTSLPSKVRRWLPRRGQADQAQRPRSQVQIWGQRMRGSWRSDGASHVEVEEFYWQADDSER